MSHPWAWRRKPLVLPGPLDREDAGRPCLVHLVREANGLRPLREFAAALRSHPPGIEHEMVLAMKGFTSPAQAAPYLEEVKDIPHEAVFFPDRGYDLDLYFTAAARLRRRRYCFVNSHARPLVDGWLAKLDAALDLPDVGQVGATGSWTSHYSWLMNSLLLPNAYRGLIPPRRVVRELMIAIELERTSTDTERTASERPAARNALQLRLRSIARLPHELLDFGPFPASHLRTNVFMIDHTTLSASRLFAARTKMDTYVLESGRNSITRQLERMGLSSLVVDRTGTVHPPAHWDRSRTFWQGDQEQLLVADNETLFYARGDTARRELLSTLAWGPSADPQPAHEAPAAAVS